MAGPAYTRMPVDERRRQLLERGAELFATHSFGELSMARIAREAGISKALLYHYFPSKQDFFVATLQPGRPGDRPPHRARSGPAAARGACGQSRRLPRLDRGERGGLSQADGERGQ